jgi:hypothetical protein
VAGDRKYPSVLCRGADVAYRHRIEAKNELRRRAGLCLGIPVAVKKTEKNQNAGLEEVADP